MQTKEQIRQLLISADISPNKRLGQHFLIDLNLMRLLVGSANIENTDVVLEVGCGTGSLTESITERAGRVVAVELDRNLAEIAGARLTQFDNVELINADILKTKNSINSSVTSAVARARNKCTGRFLLVANLPYNVASPVMMNLLTGETKADGMYVTVQKEVADRMTAGAGSKHYGILSIFLAATGDVKTIRVLKPTVFWPRPKVDSAMISFVRDEGKSDRIADMELFSETVHLFMGHRRKTVQSCCKFAEGRLAGVTNWPQILEQCGIEPTRRPEKLTPEDYVAVAGYAAKSRISS
jgi:16S rRNA (adenine1518-N6/adenine1519-N6)-dimethyltransferase